MTVPKTSVILRADGNDKIGLGHVHRLLALSEILKDNFECKFIIRSPLPGIKNLILKSCESIIEPDADFQSDELNLYITGKEIVVVDGYGFDSVYQQKIKQKGSPLVCVDDLHQQHFFADVIINPAGGVTDEMYAKESTTRLFAGPKFSLLKKVFLQAAKHRNKRASNSLLICMGGADPENHTLLALKRCLKFAFTSIQIVVGEAYLHKSKLHEEALKIGKEINILSNLEAHELADTMNACGVALCSASGISYEYLCRGGELYVKQTAANQKDLYRYLIGNKLAFPFEDFRVDEADVNKSIRHQKEIFDGKSDERILKIFNRLDFDLNSTIRLANESDLMTIFRWVNDPELRAQSFNPNPIPLDSHSEWFSKKINDPFTLLFIFEYKSVPIGQVRFDMQAEATINYSIDLAFRGRGWGQSILQKAISAFQENWKKPIKIIGYVKSGNINSNRIFKKLGFIQSGTAMIPDANRYELI